MPDDRFLHPRAGKSEKVTLLTDLEYRVWTQYILSSDDFGVMVMSALKIQADNYHLANRPQKMIQRCLETLTKVGGLLHTFVHQGRTYVFQHDWQAWQKVEYPRTTNEPKPPAESLAVCDESTRRLFEKHPGGTNRKRPKDSPNVPQIVPEEFPTTRAGGPAERLTANANGSGERLTANGLPVIARRRMDAAWEGPRVYVPQRAHRDMVGFRNHPDAERELFAWYEHVSDEWTTGARRAEPIEPDMLRFWKARYAERWPAAPATSSKAPAWAQKAQARP